MKISHILAWTANLPLLQGTNQNKLAKIIKYSTQSCS